MKRPPKIDLAPFLPRTRAEMAQRGWSELDVLLVTGDAYVDHPSFGVAGSSTCRSSSRTAPAGAACPRRACGSA
jgi:hypothetical protein